jgi:opacity protein-like surface antigen
MRHVVWGAAMALAISAAAANAQVPLVKPVSFGIAGGMTSPTGDFSTAMKTGYNASLMLQIGLPAVPVAVRLEGQYQQFNDQTGTFQGKTIGGLADVMLYVPLGGIVKPYVAGGAGYFHIMCTNGASCSQNKMGYNAGVGLEFHLPVISAFVEGDWQSIQTDGAAAKMYPVRVGLKF